MQKQTLKLQKQIALGLAAVSFMLPGSVQGSCWSFLINAVVAYNFFGLKKMKVTGAVIPEISDKKFVGAKEPGEIETEPENFGRALSIALGFGGIWNINETFGVGAFAGVGLSFSKEQMKTWKSLTISESFVGKLGIAMTFTDWVMVTAGIRASYVTASIDNFSDDDKKVLKDLNAALSGVAAGANTNVATTPLTFADTSKLPGPTDSGIKYAALDPSKSYSDSTWAWGLFLDGYLRIPLTDKLHFIITVGVSGHMFALEFKDLYTKEVKLYTIRQSAAVTTGTPVAAGAQINVEKVEDCSDLKTKFENIINLTAGFGIQFGF